MPTRLIDSTIKKAAAEVAKTGVRRDLADAACPGLRLRLTPGGAMTWTLACRDRESRMRRFTLGAFKDLGLAAAREAARALRVKVRQGGADPVAESRKQRALGKDAQAGVGTLAALLTLYGEKEGRERKSWPDCKRRIEHVFASHLRRPAALLTSSALQITADGHKARHSAAAAVRYLRPILKWGAKRGYVPLETAMLSQPAVARRRERVLDEDELRALLPVLAASDRPYAAALQLMLLTLARREEVCAAQWRDIDLDASVWTIPETKSGRPHRVPLSRQAIKLLTDRKPKKVKSTVLLFPTGTGGRLVNWDRETKAIQETSGTEGWTRHDLRRTGATMLGGLGVEPHVIEAALNHAAIHSQLAAVYNRSRYEAEVAAALQLLADRLDGVASGGAQIVSLAERRA